jgi:serine/threonine protein kinase
MAGVMRLVFALQEYVPGGELFAHLKASSNHHFSEKRTRFYIAEAVLALQHMHEKEHLVYRDIKPENMLLDEQGHLKVYGQQDAPAACARAEKLHEGWQLAVQSHNVASLVCPWLQIVDFGFAKHLDSGERTYTFCGTPDYLAPEVVLGKGSGRQADYWALGVLTFELVVGVAPFCVCCNQP